jgi:hypothetical protein
LIVLVLVFAIRGFLRGAVAQVFVVVGWFLALWAMVWIAQWVGAQWMGARPTAVFWVLRWVVSLLGALAVLALFEWASRRVGETVRDSAFGTVDRIAGVVVGAVTGGVVLTLVLLALLRTPDMFLLAHPVARAQLTPRMLSAADAGCRRAGPALPGGAWLRRQMELASERVHRQPEPPSRARRA